VDIFLLRRSAKFFLVLAFATFFLFGFLALGQAGMSMTPDGQTNNCPFANIPSVVCKMSPLGHVATWQSMFVAIPTGKLFVLSAPLLLGLLFLARLLVKKVTWNVETLHSFAPLLRTRVLFIPRYALQEAFSNGIIHSRAF